VLAGFALTIPFVPAQEAEDLRPGLVGEYFDLGEPMDDFPSLQKRKPTLRRIDRQVKFEKTPDSFAGGISKDFFAARWTGIIRLPRDGKYTFILASDDGSRLLVDGKLVVDHGGLHAMVEAAGGAELKAGDHEIRIEFFENRYDAACVVSWEFEGQAKEAIPATAFFHKKDSELDK